MRCGLGIRTGAHKQHQLAHLRALLRLRAGRPARGVMTTASRTAVRYLSRTGAAGGLTVRWRGVLTGKRWPWALWA